MVLHKGIPKLHLSFWTKIGVKDLYAIYNSLSCVSTAMVLKMVEEAEEGHNQSEERILSYLRQFIGNMGLNDLRQFVRFVTGTPTCSTLKINVSFNNVAGASRRPIAYTCSFCQLHMLLIKNLSMNFSHVCPVNMPGEWILLRHCYCIYVIAHAMSCILIASILFHACILTFISLFGN